MEYRELENQERRCNGLVVNTRCNSASQISEEAKPSFLYMEVFSTHNTEFRYRSVSPTTMTDYVDVRMLSHALWFSI